MTLRERMDAFRMGLETGLPPDSLTVLHQATDDLCRSGIQERALRAGEQAPDFTLPNAHGELVHSTDLRARGPLVVIFFRGIWCPFCNLSLIALQEAASEIEAAGATLVAISPQLPEYARRLMEQHNLTFDLLSDEGNRVAAQFGLVFTVPEAVQQIYRPLGTDLEMFNGDPSWTLPIPGTFLLDQESMIHFADVDPDYTSRTEPRLIVSMLDMMPRSHRQSEALLLVGV